MYPACRVFAAKSRDDGKKEYISSEHVIEIAIGQGKTLDVPSVCKALYGGKYLITQTLLNFIKNGK